MSDALSELSAEAEGPKPAQRVSQPESPSGAEQGRRQLSEKVATHVREQIISGQLLPGTFLRIGAIARRLDVSTTPVREGLLLLQSQAFVRLVPRRGFIVNRFGKSDLRDLFWAQATMGAELARRAASRITSDEIALLQLTQMHHEQAVASQDLNASVRLGHQFHRVINLAAGSPRIALLLGSLTKQLSNRFYALIEGQLDNALADHPLIIGALQRRDARVVQALMFSHLNSSAEHLIAKLEREGRWTYSEPSGASAATTTAKNQG